MHRIVRAAPHLGVGARQLPLQAFEIADDDGQQIVEVVRDAAGELADRFQLLRLAQGAFGGRTAVDLGIKRLGAPQDRKQGHQQQQRRRDAENEVRAHRRQPFIANGGVFNPGREVQGRPLQAPDRITTVDTVDRRGRVIIATRRELGDGPGKAGLRPQLVGRADRHLGIAGEEEAVLTNERILQAARVGQRSKELEEVAGQNGNLQHADKFSVAGKTPADGEERLVIETRRVDLTVVDTHVLFDVCDKKVAVSVALRWRGIDAG